MKVLLPQISTFCSPQHITKISWYLKTLLHGLIIKLMVYFSLIRFFRFLEREFTYLIQIVITILLERFLQIHHEVSSTKHTYGVCHQRSSIRAIADCKAITWPQPQKFIKCSDLEFTTWPAIAFIQCWQQVLFVHRLSKPLSFLSLTVIVVLIYAFAYFLFFEVEEICLISDISLTICQLPLNGFWLKLPHKFSNFCKLCWYWLLRASVFSTIWAKRFWSSRSGTGIFIFPIVFNS